MPAKAAVRPQRLSSVDTPPALLGTVFPECGGAGDGTQALPSLGEMHSRPLDHFKGAMFISLATIKCEP